MDPTDSIERNKQKKKLLVLMTTFGKVAEYKINF
jgi:hypothetical protein